MEQFYSYLRDNSIKEAGRFHRTYNYFSKHNTRQLNKEYSINGYKFTKLGDVLTIYKPIEKTDKEINKEKDNKSKADIINLLTDIEGHTNRHTYGLKTIRGQICYSINKAMEISELLNMFVNAVNVLIAS